MGFWKNFYRKIVRPSVWARPEMYVSYLQETIWPVMNLVIRTQGEPLTVAAPVRHEIEINRERPALVRNRRRGDAARRKIEGRLPVMIEQRRQPQPDFSDNLQPQMKRVARLDPVGQSELRPLSARISQAHAKSLL